jgi:hypothetical protein
LLLNLARARPKIDAFGISASFLFCLSLKISVFGSKQDDVADQLADDYIDDDDDMTVIMGRD